MFFVSTPRQEDAEAGVEADIEADMDLLLHARNPHAYRSRETCSRPSTLLLEIAPLGLRQRLQPLACSVKADQTVQVQLCSPNRQYEY